MSLVGSDHYNSKLSTNIQFEENNHSVFLIFPKLCKKIDKKSILMAYFELLRVNYRLFL